MGLGQPLQRQCLACVGAHLMMKLDTLLKRLEGLIEVARQEVGLTGHGGGEGDGPIRACSLRRFAQRVGEVEHFLVVRTTVQKEFSHSKVAVEDGGGQLR